MAQKKVKRIKFYLDRVERSLLRYIIENSPQYEGLLEQDVAHIKLKDVLMEETKQIQKKQTTKGADYNPARILPHCASMEV